ncbi:hypothetical protein K402DRAFT_394925 [Aulographum hederae CBS 113979]|uniref:Uncharacterized protein n=1 Tax=Aulographum hederae CBS 113979 TaxID=1176131 RepID=A0A6G1GW97_9PEZI|nr:hypothetical protein K402DRAFT_394925 [Aulographum hederae CBS 113979]
MTAKRPSTPQNQRTKPHEYDTVTKSRFFHAFDHREDQSLGDVLKDITAEIGQSISRRTAWRWLDCRKQIGDQAYRRTRSQSTKLGRKRKLFDIELENVLHPETNPWREQRHAVQTKKLKLEVHERTLERNLFERKDGAKKFIMARTKKISDRNRAL